MIGLKILTWILYGLAVLYFSTGLASNIVNLFKFFEKEDKKSKKKLI